MSGRDARQGERGRTYFLSFSHHYFRFEWNKNVPCNFLIEFQRLFPLPRRSGGSSRGSGSNHLAGNDICEWLDGRVPPDVVGDKDVVRGGTDIEALIKKFMGIFFRIGTDAASAASPESRRVMLRRQTEERDWFWATRAQNVLSSFALSICLISSRLTLILCNLLHVGWMTWHFDGRVS